MQTDEHIRCPFPIARLLAPALLLAIATVASGVAGQAAVDPADLFATAERCQACHNGLVTADGDEVSIGRQWQATVMAHAAKDPYWQASVRRESLEHPQADAAIQDKCSTCHMPIARFVAARTGGTGQVFAQLPMTGAPAGDPAALQSRDGVSCAVCHQIAPEGLGAEESFTGGFAVDTTTPLERRPIYGPFAIAEPTANVMRSATGFVPRQASHVQRAALCASCHTLFTHALDAAGDEVGELPEQVPYLEWLHSDYADVQSCQDCHMPQADGAVPIASVLGKPREPFVRHAFRGGNFFLLRLLGRFGADLGVVPTAQELALSARDTAEHLSRDAATIALDAAATAIEGDRLLTSVVVDNLAGHKLPTAYPSRRVWIRLTVRDAAQTTVFESGRLADDGSIEHNDNDADPARYEPHHRRIESPEQVQIFEAILGAPDGAVTTGLLEANQYLKDNRVLPFGFDKATAVDDVAVRGAARDDAAFTGGRAATGYRIPVDPAAGPFTVEAELWYQPIGHRWARNLAAFDAPEPRQFVAMYEALPARGTAIMLAAARATVAVPAPVTPDAEADQP